MAAFTVLRVATWRIILGRNRIAITENRVRLYGVQTANIDARDITHVTVAGRFGWYELLTWQPMSTFPNVVIHVQGHAAPVQLRILSWASHAQACRDALLGHGDE
jgi:hypothetical protein